MFKCGIMYEGVKRGKSKGWEKGGRFEMEEKG